MIRNAVIILLLTAVGAVATQYLHPRAPMWHQSLEPIRDDEVTPAEVQKRWHGDVLWIDARLGEIYDKEHIPGAILLNEEKLDALLTQHFEVLQENKKPIVIYCDGKACHASRKMREYLVEHLAMNDVWVLTGGWPAWKAAHPAK
ncbi:MAG: rhodanese [Verrucomicrobiaceae bacterium]|nr:rhodanese [Verrucomicrobiaceae bacterium]